LGRCIPVMVMNMSLEPLIQSAIFQKGQINSVCYKCRPYVTSPAFLLHDGNLHLAFTPNKLANVEISLRDGVLSRTKGIFLKLSARPCRTNFLARNDLPILKRLPTLISGPRFCPVLKPNPKLHERLAQPGINLIRAPRTKLQAGTLNGPCAVPFNRSSN